MPATCCDSEIDLSDGTESYGYSVNVGKKGKFTFRVVARDFGPKSYIGYSDPIEVTILGKPIDFTNYEPSFKSTPSCEALTVDFYNITRDEIYQCQLPGVEDANIGDKVKVSINKGFENRYMKFDNKKMLLSFDTASMVQNDVGFKNLEFVLKDKFGAEVSETVIIRVLSTSNINVTEEMTSENTLAIDQNETVEVDNR